MKGNILTPDGWIRGAVRVAPGAAHAIAAIEAISSPAASRIARATGSPACFSTIGARLA